MGEPRTARAADVAETGTRWWELAVRTLRETPQNSVDHSDLCALAGELVATLRVLEDLTSALASRAEVYGERSDLRDDTGADPRARLEGAALAAADAGRDITRALVRAGEFWSAVGHIGLRLDPTDPHDDLGAGPGIEHDGIEHGIEYGDGGGLS